MDKTTDIKVGEKRYYKIKEGRGHPAVGEVVRVTRNFVFIRPNNADLKIPVSQVKGVYEYRPYATKRRLSDLKKPEAPATKPRGRGRPKKVDKET